jgi:hypothetical protein
VKGTRVSANAVWGPYGGVGGGKACSRHLFVTLFAWLRCDLILLARSIAFKPLRGSGYAVAFHLKGVMSRPMTFFPWKLVGLQQPVKHDENRKLSKRAFQHLWVAGTLGAFFTALARNLPVHLSQMTAAYDLKYTLDVFVRYAYLIWLLGYFFMSALQNNRSSTPTWRDILFDVLQSTVSLGGCVLPRIHHPCERLRRYCILRR